MLNRLLILFVTLASIILYAHIKKKELESSLGDLKEVLLAKMPEAEVLSYPEQNKLFLSQIIKSKSNSTHVFHFWGTWCPPCINEFPELLRFTQKMQEQPVQFYLVAVNDQKELIEKFLKPFIKMMGNNITILIDNNGTYNNAFGAAKVPETFIFDKNGQVLRRLQGAQDWQQPFFVKLFDSYKQTK
jgi:thiol-disulfide isomerase/thioredoxin